MALTTLDPKTALVVIDLQNAVVALPGTPLTTADVVARSVELADAFRAKQLPVVLVRVETTPADSLPGRTESPRRATSIGVESSARAAYEHGYNVTLATDAMTDLNEDAHKNSLTWIFPRLGESGTTAEVLELLAKTHS
ncbi:isochorismatase family protein [Kribbella sp. NBC_00382]|uniref:isochorismatase family protein n=1 Tax=Kribbella sp. NBC_00382 TaxID=2975967 RepID=UPI002E216714